MRKNGKIDLCLKAQNLDTAVFLQNYIETATLAINLCLVSGRVPCTRPQQPFNTSI